jgi:hypothetical protein
MMYSHRYSQPSHKSTRQEERDLTFHPSIAPASIRYARPSISSWAAQLVGKRVERSVKDLTHDPKNPDSFSRSIPVRLAAAANERTRAKGVRVVTREDLMSFRFSDRVKLFKARSPLIWYLTECIAAPKKKGVLVVRKRRNPAIVSLYLRPYIYFY